MEESGSVVGGDVTLGLGSLGREWLTLGGSPRANLAPSLEEKEGGPWQVAPLQIPFPKGFPKRDS